MTAFTIVTPEEDVLGGVSVPVMNKASHPAQAPPGGRREKQENSPTAKVYRLFVVHIGKAQYFCTKEERKEEKALCQTLRYSGLQWRLPGPATPYSLRTVVSCLDHALLKRWATT